ncbi:hypothetical protein [uncultured Arthrobacter sp.]|uniref:hypothetical protein n=1 Tax=uncultured Arthrobacter sp. TaxID=114050 RepID=UPI00260CAFD7|nr:hypothetical protein [uncultured Arthrobacter sp.]
MEDEAGARHPVSISVPSRKDVLLRKLTEVVGGPLGRHAAPGRVRPAVFTVQRVLILMTTAAAVLAVLVKAPCRADGWVRPEQFYRACYSDWTEAFQFQGLGSGLLPFAEGSTFDGPLLVGVLAGLLVLLVPTSAAGIVQTQSVVQYFDLNAVLIAAVWIGTVFVTIRLASRRPWDAAIVALAPIAILTATSGWTLLSVLLSVLAVWLFAQRRYVLSGVLLGFGAGFSIHVLLVFAAIVLLAVRTGRFRAPLVTGGSMAAIWLLTVVPFGPARALALPWEYDPARIGISSSLWSGYNLLAERLGLRTLSPEITGILAFVAFAVLAALITLLVLRASRRPRLPQVILLLIGALVLVLPDYSPELTLWLLPFLALTYVDWRILFIWQLVEVLHWWAYWMFVARQVSSGPVENNIDPAYFTTAILVRLLVTGYLLYRVAQNMLEPEYDPVRRLDIDDPAGGPFNLAPDRKASAPVGLSGSRPGPNLTAPRDPQ